MLHKLAALTMLAFGLLAVALPAMAQTPSAPPSGYYGPGPGHMMGGNGYWAGHQGVFDGMFWEFPMIILVVILVCILIYYFARSSSGADPWAAPWADGTRSALQILNERYAKGEIQKEEYEERKATLLANTRR